MKVSLITATFNSGKTLADTLSSLESQTYQNIEYIIIDGSSTDDTLNVIKVNSTRVSKIISEEDSGIYDALNKGIRHASGDIIGFLHSDDILAYPDAIKDVVDMFEINNSEAVYGDLDYVSRSNTSNIIRSWKSTGYSRYKIIFGWMPPHPAFYMKRSCYERLGGFAIDYKISADYESLLRYLWTHRISLSHIPKVLVKMRLGGISNRSITSVIKKSFEDIKAMKTHGIIWPLALVGKNFSKIPQFFKKKKYYD